MIPSTLPPINAVDGSIILAFPAYTPSIKISGLCHHDSSYYHTLSRKDRGERVRVKIFSQVARIQ